LEFKEFFYNKLRTLRNTSNTKKAIARVKRASRKAPLLLIHKLLIFLLMILSSFHNLNPISKEYLITKYSLVQAKIQQGISENYLNMTKENSSSRSLSPAFS
jgi:hypothetical protein